VDANSGSVPALFTSLRCGEPDVLARLVPIVYDELRQIARHRMKLERRESFLTREWLAAPLQSPN
jgi:hypothetical protein